MRNFSIITLPKGELTRHLKQCTRVIQPMLVSH